MKFLMWLYMTSLCVRTAQLWTKLLRYKNQNRGSLPSILTGGWNICIFSFISGGMLRITFRRRQLFWPLLLCPWDADSTCISYGFVDGSSDDCGASSSGRSVMNHSNMDLVDLASSSSSVGWWIPRDHNARFRTTGFCRQVLVVKTTTIHDSTTISHWHVHRCPRDMSVSASIR